MTALTEWDRAKAQLQGEIARQRLMANLLVSESRSAEARREAKKLRYWATKSETLIRRLEAHGCGQVAS